MSFNQTFLRPQPSSIPTLSHQREILSLAIVPHLLQLQLQIYLPPLRKIKITLVPTRLPWDRLPPLPLDRCGWRGRHHTLRATSLPRSLPLWVRSLARTLRPIEIALLLARQRGLLLLLAKRATELEVLLLDRGALLHGATGEQVVAVIVAEFTAFFAAHSADDEADAAVSVAVEGVRAGVGF